jgi:hypothetical protein
VRLAALTLLNDLREIGDRPGRAEDVAKRRGSLGSLRLDRTPKAYEQIRAAERPPLGWTPIHGSTSIPGEGGSL